MDGESHVFKITIYIWKICGIWKDNTSTMCYKCYSFAFMTVFLGLFWFLFALHLVYDSIQVKHVENEATFLMAGSATLAKIIMIVFTRKDILLAFDSLDVTEFQGDNEATKKLVSENKSHFLIYWKIYIAFNLGVELFQALFIKLLLPLSTGESLRLPMSGYSFLSPQIRDEYFAFLFTYQVVGWLVYAVCDITADVFAGGLIMMAITQFKVLNLKLANIKLTSEDLENENVIDEEILLNEKLTECLKHYELILNFCNIIQEILNWYIFTIVGMTAVILGIDGLSIIQVNQRSSANWVVTLGSFLATIFQMFITGFFGSQLTHESQKLVQSAYESDWISRSGSFKRNLKLFVERANRPVVLTGFKIFSLSLETLLAIVNFAYSSFTLLKQLQDA